jgi:hypothetical protein
MTQPALDLVIAALEKIREKNDHAPRASRTALARLQNAPLAASLSETCTSLTERQLEAARNKADLLAAVCERVSACTKCAHLACSRTQTVFGVGNPNADLMFIGEAPGADEDQQGEPFVGRAGQLLTKILKAMNFAREDVYIANILNADRICRQAVLEIGRPRRQRCKRAGLIFWSRSRSFGQVSWSRWARSLWRGCSERERQCAN